MRHHNHGRAVCPAASHCCIQKRHAVLRLVDAQLTLEPLVAQVVGWPKPVIFFTESFVQQFQHLGAVALEVEICTK